MELGEHGGVGASSRARDESIREETPTKRTNGNERLTRSIEPMIARRSTMSPWILSYSACSIARWSPGCDCSTRADSYGTGAGFDGRRNFTRRIPQGVSERQGEGRHLSDETRAVPVAGDERFVRQGCERERETVTDGSDPLGQLHWSTATTNRCRKGRCGRASRTRTTRA